jgi:hypothetical protein
MSGGTPGGGAPGGPQPSRPAAAQAQPMPQLPPMEMVRLANMMHTLAHNPATREIVAEAVNRVDPNFAGKAFQDVALNRRFAALEKKITDKDIEKQVKEAVASQQRDRKQLEDAGRTKEEIEDIEKLMNARGYHSYRDASVLYDAEKPRPAQHYEANSATWEFPSVTTRDGKGSVPFKDFQKDSKTAAYNAAYRVIDEFTTKNLPPAFHR